MRKSLTGLSSMATRRILDALTQRYEASSGTNAAIKAMGGVDAAKLVRAGEPADIIILASGVMAQLEAEGLVVAGSVKAFARSGMAIAVQAGAEKPDIGGEDAVRRAVATARKVAYSTGPSGDHLLKLCERWGIPADQLVKAPPGVPVGSLVADGQAELGFQQLSELIHVAGIEVIGPLPAEIQAETIFAAGISITSSQQGDTADLIAFLTSPETDEVKRAEGMAPA
ncbi:substrate-binding domain-containing protein [Sphingomonas sp. MMS24-J13]|uniref:substrate-binding domain-containing protein n=1 Tax=Sphingomonas sp. MMS24-J13 TaxID=3238686 RepID=UPI00384C73E5